MGNIKSIYTFTRDIRHKDTLWINFNTRYNRRMNLNMTRKQLESKKHYENNPNHPIQMTILETNFNARDKFEQWIKKIFPHISYEPVFDLMPSEYISLPYLGSYAIDVTIDSDEYKTIYNQYTREDGKPNNIHTCLYIMKYADAIGKYNFDQLFKETMSLWTN